MERRILLDRNLSLSLALTPEKPPPQEAAEEAPANKLVLKVEGRSWLRVTRDGERLYEGIPEVGSELVFDLPVEVRSGNPGAVRVILGGRTSGPWASPASPSPGATPDILGVCWGRAPGRRMAKIGFVSLGCPKALVDSEQILSRLKALGYETSPSYEEAELVIVNTCGFINEAVEESLEVIGEALKENGKVVVTGCLGARPEKIRERHPQVLAITGPGRWKGFWRRCRWCFPRPGTPFGPHPSPGQAHPEALRLREALRGVRPPVQLLHHP